MIRPIGTFLAQQVRLPQPGGVAAPAGSKVPLAITLPLSGTASGALTIGADGFACCGILQLHKLGRIDLCRGCFSSDAAV